MTQTTSSTSQKEIIIRLKLREEVKNEEVQNKDLSEKEGKLSNGQNVVVTSTPETEKVASVAQNRVEKEAPLIPKNDRSKKRKGPQRDDTPKAKKIKISVEGQYPTFIFPQHPIPSKKEDPSQNLSSPLEFTARVQLPAFPTNVSFDFYPRDNDWYENDQINPLLKREFSNNEDIELLTSLPQEFLLSNLQMVEAERNKKIKRGDTVKNQILIPLHINTNHWTLLHIKHLESGCRIQFLDPKGWPLSGELNKCLHQIYPNAEIVDFRLKMQDNDDDCGPWIIEGAKILVDPHSLPPRFGIQHSRRQHREQLGLQNQVSPFEILNLQKHPSFDPTNPNTDSHDNELQAAILMSLEKSEKGDR